MSYEPGIMKSKKGNAEGELGQKGEVGSLRKAAVWSRRSVKSSPSTPVHPWRIEKEATAHENFTCSPVSARKLGALVWAQHAAVEHPAGSKEDWFPDPMSRYNPTATPSPTSSLEMKGRNSDASYGLKTSTELLNVLNRISSLEKQHNSSVSLIKALKMELHVARSKIKELVRDQQADKQEIDELIKQITQEKQIRKSKEQDRALQSMRDELENERQLREHFENLQRNLAHELVEAKSSLSNAMEELERERTSRLMLDELCDEFAKGIIDFELEAHSLRQKLPEKERSGGADPHHVILHVSEAWVAERMRMRNREAQTGHREKYSVADKLRPEVEKFLFQARQNRSSGVGQKLNKNSRESRLRQSSTESVLINDVASGPQAMKDENMVNSDPRCFEPNESMDVIVQNEDGPADEHFTSSSHTLQKPVSHDGMKSRNPSSLQLKFKEQMLLAVSNDNNDDQLTATEDNNAYEKKPRGVVTNQKSEICETSEDRTIAYLTRNHHLMSEGGSMHLQKYPGKTSSYRKRASPVRQWMTKLVPNDPNTSESSSRNVHGVKDNSLKAKLLEARMRRQGSMLKKNTLA